MSMKKSILSVLFCCMSVLGMWAQDVVTVQPKIMVIPYTKAGEDIRTILEQDVNKRITLAKIKEAFDSRGFTTVDLQRDLRLPRKALSLKRRIRAI